MSEAVSVPGVISHLPGVTDVGKLFQSEEDVMQFRDHHPWEYLLLLQCNRCLIGRGLLQTEGRMR